MSSEWKADASHRKVHTRVNVAIVCLTHIFCRSIAIEIRQTVVVSLEGIHKILTSEKEIVTVAKKIAVTVGSVKQIIVIDVPVVVCRRELNGKNSLLLVVESQFAHISVVIVEGILATFNHGIAISDNVGPIGCLRTDFSHECSSHIFIEASNLSLCFRQNLIGLLEILFDFVVDFSLAELRSYLAVGVFGLIKVGDVLENAVQIEVKPRPQGLKLAEQAFLIFEIGVLYGVHCFVNTTDSIIIVLPLKETGGVVGGNVIHLQLMDIGLHRHSAAAFVGIVAAHVHHPVGDGS